MDNNETETAVQTTTPVETTAVSAITTTGTEGRSVIPRVTTTGTLRVGDNDRGAAEARTLYGKLQAAGGLRPAAARRSAGPTSRAPLRRAR